MTVGSEGRREGHQLRIEERELEGANVWVAEDSSGVVAIAADRDELMSILAEGQGAPPDRADNPPGT